MSTRCSANQIADFVVLWGITGTFPKYCKNVEQARELKSLDLIISTLDVFVDAFCFSFENIYRKYEVNLPLSHEKFIQFLKPRCLLLTKDDKCFNFMLVCAFVSEIINSFAHYNKCYHLVEVSSKCLAAILKNRFKRIFETDSGWEELLSFCRKIHSLVYPSDKKCESEGNQSVAEVDESTGKDDYEKESMYKFSVTDKMHASFSNLTPKFVELSVERYTADDDNNEDWNTKMADSTIEKKGEKLERLCNSEFTSQVSATHILQLNDKDKDFHENTAREGDGKDQATDASLSGLTTEFPNMAIKTTVISNKKDTEKLGPMVGFKKNLRIPFEDYLAINKVTKRIEDLCTLGLASKNATHTFQLKGENSLSKEESIDKENPCHEKNAREDNEKVCSIIDKQETKKLGQMVDFKKNVTLPIEDYFSIYKVTEKLEDLCSLGLAPINTSHTLELNNDDSLPEKEATDKENTDDRKNTRQDDVVCETDSAQEVVQAASDKSDEDSVKLGQFVGKKKRLCLSFGKDLAAKKTPASASHTLQLKSEDFSPKEESIHKEKSVDEKNAREDDEKLCETSMEDSYKNDEGTERLGQMIGFKKRLILSFKKDLITKKVPENFNLFNIEPSSSADASDTLHLKGEDASINAESVDEKKTADESKAMDGKEKDYVTDSLPSHLPQELAEMSGEKNVINDNVEGAENPGWKISHRKKLTLPLRKDLAVEEARKKSAYLFKIMAGSSTDALQLEDEVSASKNESEVNEPFDIHFIPADKIRSLITDNPQHLSEIMNLLKKCEEDIDPNIFPPDEYNIFSDNDEGEVLEASGGISESSSSDPNKFELVAETIVYSQNINMGESIKAIFRESNQSDDESDSDASGGESTSEISDDVAYVYGMRMLASDDPLYSLCAGEMTPFFDAWTNSFVKKYPNNCLVSDLFTITGVHIQVENDSF